MAQHIRNRRSSLFAIVMTVEFWNVLDAQENTGSALSAQVGMCTCRGRRRARPRNTLPNWPLPSSPPCCPLLRTPSLLHRCCSPSLPTLLRVNSSFWTDLGDFKSLEPCRRCRSVAWLGCRSIPAVLAAGWSVGWSSNKSPCLRKNEWQRTTTCL